jgi:subtilisin family serine protease
MRLVVELAPLPKPLAGWLHGPAAEPDVRRGKDAAPASMQATPADDHCGDAHESRPKTPPGPEARPTQAEIARRMGVIEAKARSEEYAAPVRGALDRAAERSIRSHPADTARFPEPPVQYCWINQTFPVWVDPRELAAVAEHPRVVLIDVPRVLEPQIVKTTSVLGIPTYRQKTRRTGKGVKVAVIDSEVAQLASVFQSRVSRRVDYTGEGWNRPGGHGTAVAGIIAANSGLAQGMAPDALIYNYKVVATGGGSGSLDTLATTALAQALEDGVRIANCSWKTGAVPNGLSREARACNTAWEHGMTVVAAMGNNGRSTPTQSLTCPADAIGVIAVGATTRGGKEVPSYSGRGPSRGSQKQCPDLVAPGGNDRVGIHSFRVDGTFGENGWGTSLAVAHVSGILALLLEENPDLLPEGLRALLKSRCRKLSFVASNAQGSGIPDLAGL